MDLDNTLKRRGRHIAGWNYLYKNIYFDSPKKFLSGMEIYALELVSFLKLLKSQDWALKKIKKLQEK